MRPTCVVLTVLCASMAAAEEKDTKEHLIGLLEKAPELELYSLDPVMRNVKEGFHGYKVLGKTAVKDAKKVKLLVASFRKGVEENKGIAAACFNPRHGIRFKSGKTTVDVVICFECYGVQQYYDDKRGSGFLITDSPQPTFNKVLKDAGVELPKREK